MSMLPPFSRGGIVRSASDAIGSAPGTAPCGSGGNAMPPRPARSASRRRTVSRNSFDGATPMTPTNEPSGIRTPGRSADSANPSLIVHLAI